MQSSYIHKSHNVTVLLYHLVYPAKYRKAVFSGPVDKSLRDNELIIFMSLPRTRRITHGDSRGVECGRTAQ